MLKFHTLIRTDSTFNDLEELKDQLVKDKVESLLALKKLKLEN
jgi:hypothetical protein